MSLRRLMAVPVVLVLVSACGETGLEPSTPDVVAASAHTISVFFDDLAGFNAAAGSPPVAIDFDAITAGTDITGTTINGVTFDLGNLPAPSAPLIVVRGDDTFTTGGFCCTPNPATNKLFPTSGENVLSPGGLPLAPSPASLQNDDLKLTFDTPQSAVGFDILYQSKDCCSFVGITILGPSNQTLFSNGFIPIGNAGPNGGPGGAEFVGFVSASANIATILINEFDDGGVFPDANIGFDTYRFFATSVNTPPDADAGADQTVECTASGGASVTLDASGSSDPDGDALTYVWIEGKDTLATGVSPIVSLSLGTHTLTLTVDDGNGGTDTDNVVIDVIDTTAPNLTVTASPESLWPPNHKYRTITLSVTASDDCDDNLAVTATVVSSEPDNATGNGDGNTTGDVRVTPTVGPVLLSSNAAPTVAFDPENDQLEVRSERAGTGPGRTYTITVTATDASGNESEETVTVIVPHDQS